MNVDINLDEIVSSGIPQKQRAINKQLGKLSQNSARKKNRCQKYWFRLDGIYPEFIKNLETGFRVLIYTKIGFSKKILISLILIFF